MQPLLSISHDPTIAHSFYHRRVLRYRRDLCRTTRRPRLQPDPRRPSRDRLQALADQLQARYAIQASILKADLSEEHGIATVEQRLQQDPAIDLFINNAGTAKLAGFLASTPREHQAIHTLNTTALLRLSYAALAAFTPRRRGTLINIASILALHTLPGSAVYSASKAWVLSFTRGLQEEFADSGVRIQAVLPAATATDLWPTSGVALDALPSGTVMTTEDLVDAALRGGWRWGTGHLTTGS